MKKKEKKEKEEKDLKSVLALSAQRFPSFEGREEFCKSPGVKSRPCHFPRAYRTALKTRRKGADFISLASKPAASRDQTPWGETVSCDRCPSHTDVAALGRQPGDLEQWQERTDGMNKTPKSVHSPKERQRRAGGAGPRPPVFRRGHARAYGHRAGARMAVTSVGG